MDFTNVKNFMDHLTDWIIPGNSIVIYHENKKVFSYQSGYADLEKKVPMRAGELFNIYSCSKPLTVTAALQLYEKGKFLLDDPLYQFIPEFRNMQVRLENGQTEPARTPITMRHLFTMTAGFDYNTNAPWRARAEERTGGRMQTMEVIRELAKEPLHFHPGERWNYSMCHDVLAAAVEAISGQRFCDYVKEHIFDPLDMQTATYHPDADAMVRMAEQYRYQIVGDNDAVKLQAGLIRTDCGTVINATKGNHLRFGEEYDSGGAGITVSVADYAKLATALANGGVGANGQRILGAGTVDLMRADQLNPMGVGTAHFNTWKTHKGHSYGLGVMVMTDRALSGSNGSYGEFSWGGAAGATIHVDPERRLAYFYAHHMLNPQEDYYQPRLRNAVYSCL